MNNPRKFYTIAAIATLSFLVPLVLLSMVTKFVVWPALVISVVATLAAIAAIIPPRGVNFILCLIVLSSTGGLALFLLSSAYSATPQSTGHVLTPLIAVAVAFVALTIYGYRRRHMLIDPIKHG